MVLGVFTEVGKSCEQMATLIGDIHHQWIEVKDVL